MHRVIIMYTWMSNMHVCAATMNKFIHSTLGWVEHMYVQYTCIHVCAVHMYTCMCSTHVYLVIDDIHIMVYVITAHTPGTYHTYHTYQTTNCHKQFM